MRLKNSVDIFSYWEQIRGSRDAPLRTEIAPSSVRHILPDLFILESTADGRLRFRLAGTGICSLFGRELREEEFSSLWADAQPSDPVKIASGVLSHVVPALIHTTGYAASGRKMTFEMILMPLRSSPAVCDRLLGCLTPAVNAPWLGADALEFMALDRSRLLTPRQPADDAFSPVRHIRPVETGRGHAIGQTMRRMLGLKLFDDREAN